MTQEIVNYSMGDMERLAVAIAKSKLFGMQTPEQALALMAIAQAEGLHPAIAARDYHIIQGKPTLKADAMLARFQSAGGKLEWHTYTDECCDATMSHPQGGTVRIMWDMARVKKAQITNPLYAKYPRNMLRSRVISEGIKTIYPGVAIGVYTPEEVADFEPVKSPMAQWAETPHSNIAIEQKKSEEIDLKTWAKAFAEEIKTADSEEQITLLMTGDRRKLEELSVNEHQYYARIMQIIIEKKAEFNKPTKDIHDDLPISDELTEALAIPPALKRVK